MQFALHLKAMTHYSQVSDHTFKLIASGRRQIEPRLADAAHQNLKIGDLIMIANRHTKQQLLVKVVGLLRFGSFVELFNAYPASRFGANDTQTLLAEMRQIYTSEQEINAGVLGIKLHRLKS